MVQSDISDWSAQHVPLEQLVAFLSDADNYPSAARVTLVQTHISFVALTDDYVYKVKKPVDMGFLDFTTLEKRRFYCNEEVRLNRRMCSDTYLGVVAIRLATKADGSTRLYFDHASSGENVDPIVEYAVHMRRLTEDGFMDQLVAADSLTSAQLERVASTLAAFYAEHPATEATSAWGRIDRIRISVDENFAQIRPQEGHLLSHGAIRALEVQADRFFTEHEALLTKRRRSGMIRDCHGDLHLDHVHITEDAICIYDCIEFSERFRSIDIANDIAFLAMDLDFHGRPDLATRFEELMEVSLDDPDLPVLLPFYKTYRAVVRGKVAGFRSTEPEVPQRDRELAADEARRYFQQAVRYAVTNDAPMVIVVMGRVGTGKSTQARLLGEALGWPVVSSDVIRKEIAGVPLHKRGTEEERQRLYAQELTEKTYNHLANVARSSLPGASGVVLDATFSRRAHRDQLREALSGHTIKFVEIVAPDEVIRDRLLYRDQADQVISDARIEDFEPLNRRYEAPDPDDPVDGLGLLRITSAATPRDTQRLLLVGLANSA